MDRERIRPIVICLFRRGGRILVSEAYDSAKGDRFARPLGGGVEFGETAVNALIREIGEEVGAEIEKPKLVGVLENIFIYEGEQGHEVVFVYDAEFCDRGLYDKMEIPYREEGIDRLTTAYWASPEELKEKNIRLVPENLFELLAGL